MVCINGLPHLVQMQSKLKESGLVVVTVDLDDPNDKEEIEGVLKILRQKNVPLPNFILDEKQEYWKEKLNIEGVPLVYVFNRAGQIELKKTERPDPDKFDALIEKLLKEKAP
jgi:hypothetical protein